MYSNWHNILLVNANLDVTLVVTDFVVIAAVVL